MNRFHLTARAGFALCSAMATALLAGCAGPAMVAEAGATPAIPDTADPSGAALAKAEGRVAKSPRSSTARAELAQAYLTAGRFDSAATTYRDAVALGDASPRTGLSLALAYIGSGRNAEALNVLGQWRDRIPAGDIGLAIALAGQPAHGVTVLTDAVRRGDDNPKTRQNLAFAYALDGRWAEARVIAAQDVAADQLDARLGEWASNARPEQFQVRVASLLGTPLRSDPGQPASLALGDGGAAARLAFAEAPVAAPEAELPAVETGESFWGATSAQETLRAPDAPAQPPRAFVSQPKVARVAPAARTTADSFGDLTRAGRVGGDHLVQLGSFGSAEGARRAWGIFVARNPALKDHTMRITEAEVRGRRYFRLGAQGFDRGSAKSMCATVTKHGGTCIAYAESRPLPGTLRAAAPGGRKLATR